MIHPRNYIPLTFREAEFIIIRHTGTDRFPPHSLFPFYIPPSFSLISFTPGGENVSFLLLQILPIQFLEPVDSRQTGTHILLNAYDPQNYTIQHERQVQIDKFHSRHCQTPLHPPNNTFSLLTRKYKIGTNKIFRFTGLHSSRNTYS